MEIDFYMNLISKRLAESLSKEETSQLEAWLDQSEENRTLAKDLEEAWEISGSLGSVPEVDLDHEFSFLEAKMEGLALEETEPETPTLKLGKSPEPANNSNPFNWFKFAGIAASIALLAVIGYWLLPQSSGQATAEWKEVFASNQRKAVSLPDGSKVTLNRNSKISYPEKMEGEERTVRLEGEAFFEVRPDQNRTFAVLMDDQRVEVLGTSFNIVHHPGEQTSVVQVATGKVRFSPQPNAKGLILLPGDRATFNRETKQVQKASKASPNAFGWVSRTLIYQNTPLKEVSHDLENLFSVRIQLMEQPAESCPFSGTFKQMALPDILSQITIVLGGEVEQIEEGHFQLKGIQCK